VRSRRVGICCSNARWHSIVLAAAIHRFAFIYVLPTGPKTEPICASEKDAGKMPSHRRSGLMPDEDDASLLTESLDTEEARTRTSVLDILQGTSSLLLRLGTYIFLRWVRPFCSRESCDAGWLTNFLPRDRFQRASSFTLYRSYPSSSVPIYFAG
jgi:hypothetical protein